MGGGKRGTDRRTLGVGGTIWGFSSGPRSWGGHGGIVRAGAPGFTPFPPQLWGQFAQNGVFSAQIRPGQGGVAPTFPSALRGSPMSLRGGAGFGVLRAANRGGVLQSWGGGRGSPQNPKSAAWSPLFCPPSPAEIWVKRKMAKLQPWREKKHPKSPFHFPGVPPDPVPQPSSSPGTGWGRGGGRKNNSRPPPQLEWGSGGVPNDTGWVFGGWQGVGGQNPAGGCRGIAGARVCLKKRGGRPLRGPPHAPTPVPAAPSPSRGRGH